MQNRYPGNCTECGKHVAAGRGTVRKLAGRWRTYCAKCAPVEVTEGPRIRRLNADGTIEVPYEPENLDILRAMPGARWDKASGRWTVSLAVEHRERLLELADRIGLEVAPELRAYDLGARVAAAEARAADPRLYPFQRDGVRWLASHRRALLGDDMGLGKTVQTLLALDESQGAIVVAPASLKYNWRNEAARWRPDLRPVVLEGRASFRWPEKGEVVVVNFDILPAWLEESKRPDDVPAPPVAFTLVVDEASLVRNPKALRSKRVRGLGQAAERIWLLTGTPVEARPWDLWGLLSAGHMEREVFGSFGTFLACFHAVRGPYGYEFGSPRPDVPERLRRVMLRRRKTEVLQDLPPKRHVYLPVNGLSVGLARKLDALFAEWADMLAAGELPPFEAFSAVRQELAEARIPAMMEIIEEYEATETPLVVFSAHRAPVEAAGRRPGWAMIVGGMPAEERQSVVDRFQRGELKGVALTIGAGGYGLTLTRAADVLFVDREWNPAPNVQAEDRVLRIGQTASAVTIKIMVSEHPIDRRVLEILANKVALYEAAVERTVAGVKRASETEEEWRARVEAAQKAAEEEERQRRIRERESRLPPVLARQRERAVLPETPITPERARLIRAAFAHMRSVCDGATTIDGVGFNKPDAALANLLEQWGLDHDDVLRAAERMLTRYHGQLALQFPGLFDAPEPAAARPSRRGAPRKPRA